MKKIVFIFVLLLAGFTVKAQETADKSKTDTSVNIEGTYQIEVINTRNQPNIPGNLKQLVLEKREASKIVYVPLGTKVRLKILPLSEINKSTFKPLQPIVHVFE